MKVLLQSRTFMLRQIASTVESFETRSNQVSFIQANAVNLIE